MKKIAFFCIALFAYLNASDVKFDAELAAKADKAAYPYEKKVRTMKRIGIEYCIKGNDFYETRTDIQVLSRYKSKLGLAHNAILPPLELQSYIDSKSIISDKTTFQHYKNSNLSRFYVCLDLYDSKEYQGEVERIVKKYCKDCK